jgi:TonB-dependent starch-binding outer membrane protein SusC
MDFTALCSVPRRAGFTKTMRIMKITALLMFLGFLHVGATGFSQNVTLSLKNASLEKVFTEIEKQTGYNFIYFQNQLDKTRAVDVDAVDIPLEKVLEQIFKDQPLTYSIEQKFIVVKQKPSEVVGVTTNKGLPPPGEVHGRVTDSTGAPLEGVNVSVKGTKKGATTGANGEFVLKDVQGDAELVFSSVGYEVRMVKLGGRQDIRVEMHVAAQSLVDAVVNKGYYSTSQRLNTGDMTTVKGEEIQEQPVSDPILALEGRVPGLYIQQTSGAPGSYSTIQIRGQNSIANGNDPLYIVDGVPYSSVSLTNSNVGGGAVGQPANSISNVNGGGLSPFNSLNPSDIESITVLKDADATAIYGSRGANGVILITTKRGKAGNTKFDLNVYTGGGQVTRKMDLLNTQQYLEMRREAFSNDGLAVPSITTNPTDDNYDINGVWDTTRYTNWQKVLIGNVSNFTNVQGNLSGGNANTQFVVGAGYNKQGTAFLGDFFDQKASAYFNLNHTSNNQRFHAQLTASYINDNNKLPSVDLTSDIALAPDAPSLFDQFGNVNWQLYEGTSTFSNPMTNSLVTSKAITDNLISNLNLGYRFFDELWLKCSLGYNHSQMNQTYLQPSTATAPPFNTSPYSRVDDIATTDFKTWIIEPQLEYKKTISGGQLAILVGSTFQERDQSTMAEAFLGFSEDALISDPAAASLFIFDGNNYTLYRYDAIYGRVSYDWQEKYLLNLTARRDGSSRFGPGKQFGDFGAIGAGWVFSKEKFVENTLPWLSFGKLRGSYGITGNDQITDYQYLSTYTPSSTTYEGATGLYPTSLANPYFAWEIVKKLEGGIELGFLKDRILTSVSVYRDRSGNQLVGYALPATTGFGSIQFNFPAIVQNSGIELTLNTNNIKSKNFLWKTTFNMTIPNNKLVAFPDIADYPEYANRYVVGKSLYIQKLFQPTGVNPQTGVYSFTTKNANGVPSYPNDLVSTKPVTQNFYGGFQNTFSYKGFQLDVLFQFVKQIAYNYLEYFEYAPGQYNENQPTAVLSRWQNTGQLTNIQRFGTTSTTSIPYGNLQSSNAVLTDASFIRLKNLALSYQLPSSWKSTAHLQNARVYLQCQNLWTMTKYLGLDPETGGLNLPPLRMITGGIQVSFN